MAHPIVIERLDVHEGAEELLLPTLLDQRGLAGRLGITERHVRRLVAERRIPYVKVGRFVRFDPRAVAAWIGTRTFEPSR